LGGHSGQSLMRELPWFVVVKGEENVRIVAESVECRSALQVALLPAIEHQQQFGSAFADGGVSCVEHRPPRVSTRRMLVHDLERHPRRLQAVEQGARTRKQAQISLEYRRIPTRRDLLGEIIRLHIARMEVHD